jgi:multiple sugar transport system substrate-binding protein
MATTLKVAFVGGPMYDGMYARLPLFERKTGVRVEIGFKGDHPALNEHLAEHGGEYDLVSTHSKYAPSQAQFLRPLDNLIAKDELAGFSPSTIVLMTYKGQLLQLPRVIDSKIILYRKDLFDDPGIQVVYHSTRKTKLAPPATWDELVDIATFCNLEPGKNGFVFPGKESGLFGHFYEILESAGGELFTPDLEPGFVSDAGRYAVRTLVRLYRDAAPKEVPDWHYDQVAAYFQAGKAAMTTDWPGAYHGYQNSTAIGKKFDVAIYPKGPAGKRRVYSGGHSFALTTGTRDVPAALELLRFLTSEESQTAEALLGSVVPRTASMQSVRKDAAPGSREARRLEILEETMRECMAIPPKFPTYPACEDALWSSIRSALLGKLDVDGALREAAAAVVKVATTDKRR